MCALADLRGSIKNSFQWITSTLNDSDCECTAILLQDIGLTGPEGPPLLRNVLGEHKILAHYSVKNKARTVAIIVHKSWKIISVLRDSSGSLLGTVIVRAKLQLLLVSAYLPPTLDNYGVPMKWNSSDDRQ